MAAYGPPGAPAGGCCASSGPCAKVCILVTDCATSFPIYDATLEVFNGTTSLGTCVTNDKVVSQLITTSPGSSYTSVPTVTISGGGGSGAAGVATVNPFLPHGVSGIQITNAGTGYTSAPTVTISGGGGSGATAIAHIGGGCCIPITSVATRYTLTRSGYVTSDVSIAASCPADYYNANQMVPTTSLACFVANGCHGSAVNGVTIIATEGGVTVASGTTGGGNFCATVPTGSISYTASSPRLTFNTLTGTVLTCQTTNFPALTGTVASGYVCALCELPVATTLTLTDSRFGAFTLAYNATGANGAGWYGSKAITVPACAAWVCIPAGGIAATLSYALRASDFALQWQMQATGTCVDNQGNTFPGQTPGSTVCPPSLLLSWTLLTPASSYGPAYCGGANWTASVTE